MTIKFGTGYIRLLEDDGSEIRVTVDQRTSPSGAYVPYPIKDVSALADSLK